MKLKERSKMKRLIAIVLGIALLSPTPANANGSTYQLLTPVLTTTYELPAQDRHSRWDTIKIPFSVILISDGTVSGFAFVLIDAEGFELSTRYFNAFSAYETPRTWTQNDEWKLYQHDKAKLPIRLKTEIRFWSSLGKPTITQTFPMNFTIHKDDLAEKAKSDAEAKALAEAVAKAKAEAAAELKAKQEAEAKAAAELKAKQEAEAKAIAEAKAKVEAELKAKQEAELKAKQEAEAKDIAEAEAKAKSEAEIAEAKAKAEAEKLAPTWYCFNDPTKNKMTYAEALVVCAQVNKELKDKQEAEARASAEALLKPFVGKSCKKLRNYKVIGVGTLQCIKVKNKKVWGKLKLN
jgi:hypothetical protein